jgi:hypothetical protein
MRAQVKKSESVEARYPDNILSDLRSEITTSRKYGKTDKPVLAFRFFRIIRPPSIPTTVRYIFGENT